MRIKKILLGLPVLLGLLVALPVRATFTLSQGGTATSTAPIPKALIWFDGTQYTSTSSTLTIGNLIATSTGTNATSTFANGISLSAGCVTVGGTCLGSGSVSSVSNSDSSLTISPTTGAVVASLNVNNGNTWTALQQFNNHIGMSSTSPQAILGINPTAGSSPNDFIIGSSTGTDFIVDNAGRVGIGTSTTVTALTIRGQELAADPYGQVYIQTTGVNQDTALVFESTESSAKKRWFIGSGQGGGSPTNDFRIVGGIDNASNLEVFNASPTTAHVGFGVVADSNYPISIKLTPDATSYSLIDLEANSSGSGAMIHYSDSINYNFCAGTNNDTTGDFIFKSGCYSGAAGTERMRVKQNGNVGIASSTSAGKVVIVTSATSTAPNLILDDTTSGEGGCIIMKDSTGNTFTELYTQSGLLLSKATTNITACN